MSSEAVTPLGLAPSVCFVGSVSCHDHGAKTETFVQDEANNGSEFARRYGASSF